MKKIVGTVMHAYNLLRKLRQEVYKVKERIQ